MSAPTAGTMADLSPRRHLSGRGAEVVGRLVEAAALDVEQHGYAEVTMRSIARLAGVAPATAYTYFSSKDHLLAETMWRRLRALPPPDPAPPAAPERAGVAEQAAARVAEAVRQLGLGTTESPALVAACTTALLSSSPDVAAVRLRLGQEIRRRLAAAVGGDEPDGAVLRVLETTYFGAMLTAGLGHRDFAAVPAVMAEAAALLVGRGAGEGSCR